jgi:pyrroline-5-carboxylate reductase
LVVSIAAGISLDQLCGWIGHKRVIRVMPNTPCLVGEGASAFCGSDDVTKEDNDWIESMLSSVGLAVQVEEKQMDAVTGLSGSGPAYVCLIIEALADGGVLAGLPRQMAMKLATQTVLGTARMVAETGRHPGELKDAVASPGGTTIAAIAVLEQNGVRGALVKAVEASAKRSQELGGNR